GDRARKPRDFSADEVTGSPDQETERPGRETLRPDGGTKKGDVRSTSPKMKRELNLRAVGCGGELRAGRLRLRRGAALAPATERLQAEIGELLGPDAVVLLDRQL